MAEPRAVCIRRAAKASALKPARYLDLVQIPSVEKLWRLGVLSPRSGGQNSRPDCRRGRRSARQLSDLELSLLDLFRQFDAADRDCRCIESLESQHRRNPLFHPTMILLHDIVQIFAGSDPHTTRHA